MDKRRPRIFSRKDHEGRLDLTGEYPLTDSGQIVGALVFFTVWVLDSFVLKFSVFLSSLVPGYIRLPLAVPLLILAFYMAWTGLNIVFKEVREPAIVIEKGVFSWVRHPIYLSELMLYLGLFLISPSLISLGVIFLIFLFLDFVANQEEKKLEEKFGRSYSDYRSRVGKWFPKLS
jgi:protein-S-isoprenylcysteine O-methyltransferase Ste14